MASYRANELTKWIVLTLWMIINVILFVTSYVKFDSNKEYVYLKAVIKNGLPWARGSAACLNFNCMLILIPVCRNLISSIRGCKCTRSVRSRVLRVLDKNITFHRCVGYMICICTAIHVGAHVFNFQALVACWDSKGLDLKLSQLSDEDGHTYINPIRKSGVDPTTELFTTVAGLTGVLITVCLILMVTSSTEVIRRSYFEVFWFTHHIFIIFFAGLIFHGFGELLRYQTNVADHDPVFCGNQTNWMIHSKCKVYPQFQANGPQTWKWVVAPLCLYFLERIVRFFRSLQGVQIVKVVKHPSKVIEIIMKKPGFQHEAGQYIFLQCPSISQLEWHPFTLTSAAEDDTFSVHIRIVGDWTDNLDKYCGSKGDGSEQDAVTLPIKLSIDGPFGTACTDIFKYPVVACIGAGIGVTPFASVLKSIWYQHRHHDAELLVKKVYFYWICPDTNAFEWFSDLLQHLENQMAEQGNHNFLDYNIYLTRGWGTDEARNIMLHEDEAGDVITGLVQKTHYGRPQWDRIFKNIADSNHNNNIGTFFCGPSALSHVLHKMCNHYSDKSKGVKFYYNKENF